MVSQKKIFVAAFFLFLAGLKSVKLGANFYDLNSVFGKSSKDNIAESLTNCMCDRNGSCLCENSGDPGLCHFYGPYGIFLPRPQGLNSAAIINPYLYQYANSDYHLRRTNLGYRYSETRDGKRIATSLFGSNKLNFQGSIVQDRSNEAIVADWFGLDPLYSGAISFEPRIRQHHLDFGVRLDLGEWKCDLQGLWLAIQGTLVRANWDLRADIQNETTNNCLNSFPGACIQPGDEEFPGDFTNIEKGYPLYMSAEATNFATKLSQVLGGTFTFGDMKTPWKYGKFCLVEDGRSQTKLANLDFLIGHDFCANDNKHLSVFVKAVAPTGTKLDQETARYIFNPIIGNGHYWELGAGIDTHCKLYCYNESSVSLYLTGSITHLFANKQWRTFDFEKYGPLSRYMLLKELVPTDKTTEELYFNFIPLEYEYAGSLQNAVNYTTRKIKSSFKIQGDASLQFLYQDSNLIAGIGYNIYGRSQEKIEKIYKNNMDKKIFGIKGVTGTHYENGETLPLNATQTNAPSLSMTSIPKKTSSPPDFPPSSQEVDNGHPIDSEYFLWDSINDTSETTKFVSAPPVPISLEDLAIKELPTQIIHKIFAHAEYKWTDCCNEPYIGVYGEYDLANKSKCNYSTPNQWSVGVRGGISF